MIALVKYGQKPDMVELRTVPEPRVSPGTVILEIKAAGICGWDIEMWRHRMANPVTVPVIQGHEYAGVIVEVGPGVSGWQVGDRVVGETSASVCGSCRWCRSGNYQVCPERKGYGYGVDGAFAKYLAVRQGILHRIPAGLSFEEAALTEPFCVGHHALTDMARIQPGDTVLVIGPGPIGLVSLQMAGLQGAARTILVGRKQDQTRMALARSERWADHVFGGESDPVAAVMDLTGGEGVDMVVDAAGNSDAVRMSMECVRRMGHIVKIGWGPKPLEHSLDALLRKSVSIAGTFGHNWGNWEAVLRLMGSGRIRPKSMISAVLPLEQWQEGFEKAESLEAVKVVLHP